MIYIRKETNNTFIRRLNDLRTIANPYFLWELKRETDGNTIYFMLDDISDYTCAYNMFDLQESITGTTSGGTNVAMKLKPGQYEYKIYESTVPTLSVSATTGNVIEKDMLVVEMIRTVNTSASTINNIYY